MAVEPEFKNEQMKLALEHAWAWFSLHAAQRLQSVNFFLVATAFLSGAFVTAVKEELHVLAVGISLLAAFVSFFFYRMERRIRTLIHAAEYAIEPLQKNLAESLGIEALNICSRVEKNRPGEWKYSKVFRYLYLATGIMFVLGLLFSIWSLYSTTPDMIALKLVLQAVLGAFLVVVGYELHVTAVAMKPSNSKHKYALGSMIGLGFLCVLAGIVILCHLVFVRL